MRRSGVVSENVHFSPSSQVVLRLQIQGSHFEKRTLQPFLVRSVTDLTKDLLPSCFFSFPSFLSSIFSFSSPPSLSPSPLSSPPSSPLNSFSSLLSFPSLPLPSPLLPSPSPISSFLFASSLSSVSWLFLFWMVVQVITSKSNDTERKEAFGAFPVLCF